MQTIRSPEGLSAWREGARWKKARIGLVPTMGAFHAGHLSLIRKARRSCDAVVVSLFVNPRQFGKGEDFGRYPRRFRKDAAACRDEGVDLLFTPTQAAMYPPGYETSVTVETLPRRWEGEFRPEHFEGVATIVTKLISLVRPHAAFFGQKDYQQALVVKRLVADLHLGAKVIVCPTVREPDGLALSSRNEYLTRRDRRAAGILYAALRAGQQAIRRGERVGFRIRQEMLRTSRREPRAKVDYLAVCDLGSLEPVTRVNSQVILIGALRVGRVRLIDNLIVKAPSRSAG